MLSRSPVIYVTDLTFDLPHPADLFDIAYLMRSPDHDLRAVTLTAPEGDGERVLEALALRADTTVTCRQSTEGLAAAIAEATEPVNLIVVGGYERVEMALAHDREMFRAKVARLFLVGGYINRYVAETALQRLPINPRLRERHPDLFAAAGEPRLRNESAAFGRLLTSGEGVIWLPRDICLWRYSAPGMLAGGGPVTEFLLRELYFWHQRAAGWDADRYDAADQPVLLSALPAFLLARQPDPFAWMRLFRATTARVTVGEEGTITDFATNAENPNLYVVTAIDGTGLSKAVTPLLRDRPLTGA